MTTSQSATEISTKAFFLSSTLVQVILLYIWALSKYLLNESTECLVHNFVYEIMSL